MNLTKLSKIINVSLTLCSKWQNTFKPLLLMYACNLLSMCEIILEYFSLLNPDTKHDSKTLAVMGPAPKSQRRKVSPKLPTYNLKLLLKVFINVKYF